MSADAALLAVRPPKRAKAPGIDRYVSRFGAHGAHFATRSDRRTELLRVLGVGRRLSPPLPVKAGRPSEYVTRCGGHGPPNPAPTGERAGLCRLMGFRGRPR